MADPNAYREAVVARLRYLLELRGLSVTSLEKELGRGRGYVSDALRGEKRFALEVLLEVLEYLEIEPEEFFAGRTSDEARWDPRANQGRQRASEIADKTVTSELLKRIQERAKASGDPLLEDVSGLLKLLTRVLEVEGLVTAEDVEAVLGPEKEPADDKLGGGLPPPGPGPWTSARCRGFRAVLGSHSADARTYSPRSSTL